jgi:hypothetical protein
MLEKQAVVEGETGRVLADFLIEFLPFEEEQKDIIESVRLVLQPGLISQQEKEKLWEKTKTKRSYYVGFLHSAADNLPVDVAAHPEHENISRQLQPLIVQRNPYAIMLEKVLSAKGQAFIQTIEDAFKKPGNQDVVVSLLDAVAKYFASIVPQACSVDDIQAICNEAEAICCSDNAQIKEVISAINDAADKVQGYLCAMTVLACLSVKLVNPIFARTDAIGTVMRKKIKPITDSVFEQLRILRN